MRLPGTAPPPPPGPSLTRGAVLLAAYLVLYLALDRLAFIHPMRGFSITPWNPQSALAVALLLWRPRAWWLVALGLFAGECWTRGSPLPWPVVAVSAGLLTLGSVATAAGLRRWVGAPPVLSTRGRFVAFAAVIALGSLLGASLYVAGLAAFDIPPADRIVAAVLRGWIGEAVGLLVVLPVLFMLVDAEQRRRTRAMLGSLEWWLCVLVGGLAAYVVFDRPADEPFKYFYLLFLPVTWAAARFGVVGSCFAAAIVQLLLIAAVAPLDYRPLTVFELQLLMSALAATGLLLGTTVDEREAAEAALRASLRKAAAGEMAAALAHELNQPLTALSTYARASQLLAERVGPAGSGDARQLHAVTRSLVDEARRAGDVVRRLRDFFRAQASERHATPFGELVQEVIVSQQARADALHVRLTSRVEPDLPAVWLDPVQIGVVLRNLLANAIDAATAQAAADRWVALSVGRAGAQLRVEVDDSGAGIDAGALAAVFEPRPSSKPGGMGVGLGISRSIVEAHGGRLWAEAGPGGRFRFTLPLPPPVPA